MEELQKVRRVAGKALEGAPHETWLVIDATSGQNAIVQAQEFTKEMFVTGIVLTKLDGTAKGGVILGIADQLRIPVRYIGVGERVEDLREFEADDFVDALFGEAPAGAEGET
jgi:fused signal recognition particle receptor